MNSLETHVLRLIGENIASPDVYTDDDTGLAPIRASLNDAIEELCMVTGHYRRRYFLALQEERPVYRLAPENDYMGWILNVWDRSNHRPLEMTDLTTLAAVDPWFLKLNGPVTHWYQMGWEHVGFYRRPASKGTVLEMDCMMVPRPYTYSTEPIKLRDNWQRGAVYRAVSDYHAIRGDAARATEYYQRYLEIAGLMSLNPLGPERFWQFRGGPNNDLGRHINQD